jgi:hypothetical protein
MVYTLLSPLFCKYPPLSPLFGLWPRRQAGVISLTLKKGGEEGFYKTMWALLGGNEEGATNPTIPSYTPGVYG